MLLLILAWNSSAVVILGSRVDMVKNVGKLRYDMTYTQYTHAMQLLMDLICWHSKTWIPLKNLSVTVVNLVIIFYSVNSAVYVSF